MLLSGVWIICSVIERSGNGLVETRGDQGLILELTVDAGGRLLDCIHQRLAGLAARKRITAPQQIVRKKPVDRGCDRGLAIGNVAFASGSPIKSDTQAQSDRQCNDEIGRASCRERV